MSPRKNKPAQFLECLRAWCEHFHAPPVRLYEEPGVEPSREDRCLIRATPEWLEWLKANSQGPYRCLQPWSFGIEKHEPLGLGIATVVQGWQGMPVTCAVQINHHHPPKKRPFLEFDWDLLNKASGLLGLLGHGIEWAWLRLPRLIGRPKRKTNPYRIARMLRRRGIPVERV